MTAHSNSASSFSTTTSMTSSLASLTEYHIAVVGRENVGKSALTIQYIQHIFTEEYDPTIEDSYTKRTRIDNKACLLEIVDTSGQDEYKILRDSYMRSASAFLLVLSVTDRKSMDAIREFHEHILRVNESKVEEKPMVLVCNKCDLDHLQREVSIQEARVLAKELGIPHVIETSAKTRWNVEEAFELLIREARKNSDDGTCFPMNDGVNNKMTRRKHKLRPCVVM
ncbi:hypothetical protein C9374_003982 [Naegleria lovaniensis]|uniref:Ras family small GTPase n=1 Tax=Naegleria lovaniensis TaxID=51637 RepID=A0AA88H048_NAELO|nr:uncharacterized protein C9374_003982 [Naegleria lovaniensis]KAG2394218.1 hypothetical protein C9374_003982 [Naegleria lovaniensis]